jgi:transcriptional regulator with XRE-family HTH domain
MYTIKNVRKKEQLTQSQFAQIVGYSESQIKRLEKSNRPLSRAQFKLLHMYQCYRNLTTAAGKWRTARDMQIFTHKVVDILKKS